MNHDDALAHGQQLARQGQYAAAIDVFRDLLSAPSSNPLVPLELGYALKDSGAPKEAERVLEQGLTDYPDDIRLLNAYGLVQNDLGQYDVALETFDKAVVTAPNHPGSKSNRARTLLSLGRAKESAQEARAAVALDPKLVPALQTLQLALFRSGQVDEGLALCREIAADPDPSIARLTLKATALEELGLYQAAVPLWLSQAQALDTPHAWLNAALATLRIGDYEHGWTFWSRRSVPKAPSYQYPEWSGIESIRGKSLLIYPEQGFGDCIQFLRYLSRLSALQPKTVTLGLPQALEGLYQALPNVKSLQQGAAIGVQDFQCSLASLPAALLAATGDISIPSPLRPPRIDDGKVSAYRSQLPSKDRLRVGLAVSGNPDHANDHNRSMPLLYLESMDCLDIDLIFLQQKMRATDFDAARRLGVHTFGEKIADFTDAAALTTLCDVVISIDSAPAHLAASLGIETIVLLPYLPDWRWGIDLNTSIWYPTVTLIRQDASRNWQSVADAVTSRLVHRLGG